jgi:hypothetical protein
MAINAIAVGERNSMCDALVDAIDVGGAGTIEIHTAGFGAQLATLTFNVTAFGAAAAGVATAAAITGDLSADATGTAALFRIRNGSAAIKFEGTVGAGSGDIDFNSVAFVAGDAVDITDFMTITMPAG